MFRSTFRKIMRIRKLNFILQQFTKGSGKRKKSYFLMIISTKKTKDVRYKCDYCYKMKYMVGVTTVGEVVLK